MAERYVNMVSKLAAPSAISIKQIVNATKTDNLLQNVNKAITGSVVDIEPFSLVKKAV